MHTKLNTSLFFSHRTNHFLWTSWCFGSKICSRAMPTALSSMRFWTFSSAALSPGPPSGGFLSDIRNHRSDKIIPQFLTLP